MDNNQVNIFIGSLILEACLQTGVSHLNDLVGEGNILPDQNINIAGRNLWITHQFSLCAQKRVSFWFLQNKLRMGMIRL
jgi:hypothetical protein